MFQKTSICLLCLLLSVVAFAGELSPRSKGKNAQKAVENAVKSSVNQRIAESALNVDVYIGHKSFNECETDEEQINWEFEKFTVYYYQAAANEPGAQKYGNRYIIESKEPLPGRVLVGSHSYTHPREYASAFLYRTACKAYALTDNWAVMAGSCLNPSFYSETDPVIITGMEYGDEPVVLGQDHEIRVQGALVSKYYYSPELTLLYAKPNTPLAQKLANAPKVNLRILNKPQDITALASCELVVKGKERRGRAIVENRTIKLETTSFFSFIVEQASDALFYKKEDNFFLLGFNDGRLHSVLESQEETRSKNQDYYMREESLFYYTLPQKTLDFIKAKTGKDWATVGKRVWLSK